MSTVELLERMSTTGSRIDRAANIIRNVKVCGIVSSNGRRYPPATLQAAAHLYSGAKVNANHAGRKPEAQARNVHPARHRQLGDAPDRRRLPPHPLYQERLRPPHHLEARGEPQLPAPLGGARELDRGFNLGKIGGRPLGRDARRVTQRQRRHRGRQIADGRAPHLDSGPRSR